MNLRTTLFAAFLFFTFQTTLNSQIVGDLNTDEVSELDAVQLPSGTWLATSMEIVPDIGVGYRVLVHRSTDNGYTWTLEKSFEVTDAYTAIGDPVIAVDVDGNAQLLFMSLVNFTGFNVHLSLYTSNDDGENWEFVSRPYAEEDLADTPQLLIDDNNTFYISYTLFDGVTIQPSETHFIKSEDGGLNWTDPIVFDSFQTVGDVGSYISQSNEQINLVFNDYNLPFTYFSSSQDEGNTWTDLIEFPNTIDFAINKIVSHKDLDNVCVLTHQAHNPTSGIHINYSLDNGISWESYFLVEDASMAEGYMDDDGNIHLTYNQIIGDDYSLNYIYSTDGGASFSEAQVLFQDKIFQNPLPNFLLAITGESQSMILGEDNMFHVTFIDWSDETKAKHLIFEPFNFFSSDQLDAVNQNNVSIYPNPSSDFVHVTWTEQENFTSYSVHDLAGKTYKTASIASTLNNSIDVRDLDSGTYFLRLNNDKVVLIKKIIVL